MDIHSLMKKFSNLGYASIGRGPKNTESPRSELQQEIDNFLDEHPYLRNDSGYVDFLEYYSGARVDFPEGELVIDIFGFLEEIGFHLIKDRFGESDIDEQGYFMFCTTVVQVAKDSDPNNEELGLDYAFDATGKRTWGIYRVINYGEYEWYCSSFLEWLEKLIDKKGLLLEQFVKQIC